MLSSLVPPLPHQQLPIVPVRLQLAGFHPHATARQVGKSDHLGFVRAQVQEDHLEVAMIAGLARDSASLGGARHPRDTSPHAHPACHADSKVPVVVLDQHRSPGNFFENIFKFQHSLSTDGVRTDSVSNDGHVRTNEDLDGGEDEREGVNQVD